jgi:uroporphyrinogen III methyltransferase/synthase
VTVYLVGAGPGDPGLLTLRGAEVLRQAEVVVYDRLSVAALLDLAPAGAERISVGKAPGRVTMAQEEINALLVRLGQEGKRVVRLKGGDPYVFARGGEEAAALAAADVAYEVVPGITSALAAPAYAGIPVTLRHSSTSFTVVTGHEDPSKHDDPDGVATGDRSVDWDAVARVGGTIVILMGVARWPAISRRLVEGGLDPDTPAAAVQWGTRPEQRSIRATLATLGDHELASPSVIVVGVVAAEQLDWFEARPLFGRRIVVTRPRERVGRLAARLREQGAEVIEAPAIVTVDPADDGAAVRLAASSLAEGAYDWVVCTSLTGVERLFAALHDARDLGGVRVAAVGPGTARAFAARGVVADLVPEVAVGDDLAAAFPVGEGRVLQIRPEVARDVVARELRAKGWHVDEVVAYRTVSATLDDETRARVRDADAVTFTSSSTVDNLVDLVGIDGLPAVTASIGPITTLTLEAHGLEPTCEARPHTVDGLVAAMVEAFAGR